MTHDDHPGRTGPIRRRHRRVGPAAGLAWCAGTTIGSALLVPADPSGGYYLIDHGRTQHFDTSWDAVGSVAVITALMVAVAGVMLGAHALLTRQHPSVGPSTGLSLAAGSLLLLAGLIQLTVPLTAAHPGSSWAGWLVLGSAALFVTTVFAFAVRATWQAKGTEKDLR